MRVLLHPTEDYYSENQEDCKMTMFFHPDMEESSALVDSNCDDSSYGKTIITKSLANQFYFGFDLTFPIETTTV